MLNKKIRGKTTIYRFRIPGCVIGMAAVIFNLFLQIAASLTGSNALIQVFTKILSDVCSAKLKFHQGVEWHEYGNHYQER
jgi:hypothetical protein